MEVNTAENLSTGTLRCTELQAYAFFFVVGDQRCQCKGAYTIFFQHPHLIHDGRGHIARPKDAGLRHTHRYILALYT